MRNEAPQISVLVPAYQYGRFLPECLESVLAQSGVSLEVLIADNASTDDTPEVSAAFALRDSRVTVARQPKNVGYARNVNWLLERGRGRFLTVLGSDDRYLEPEFLAGAVAALEAHPRAAFFHSAYLEVGEDGCPRRTMRYYDSDRVEDGHDALLSLLGLRYPWISTVVVPREVYGRAGGFDLEYEYAWDLAWFWKLALAGDVAYSPRAGVTYRQHGESLSGSPDEAYKRRHVLAALERFRARLAHWPALVEACERSCRLLRSHLDRCQLVHAQGSGETGHEARLDAALARWRREGHRVLVYGAGMHTRQLFERHDFSGVDVVGFADRDPAYSGEQLRGVPIVPPAEIESTGANVVLISSRFYEDEIVRDLCDSLSPACSIQRIYGDGSPIRGTSIART